MKAEDLADQATLAVEDGYAAHHGLVWPISVYAAEGEARDETVARVAAAARLRNGKIRVSDEARLAEEGFRLVHTPDDPATGEYSEEHYDIDLGTINDHGAIERLVSLFDEPERNPWQWKG